MNSVCAECRCTSFTFDDHLGENVCDDCGLVHVVRPFEESVRGVDYNGKRLREPTKGRLGSIIMETDSNQMFRMKKHNKWASNDSETDIRTVNQCMMILSNYSFKNVELVRSYLRSLNSERVFNGIPVEHRSASLTYYIIKESGIPMNLTKHSDFCMVERKYISRYGKRVAKHFRKSHILSTINPNQVASTVLDKLDNVSSNYRHNTLIMIDFVNRYCDLIAVRFTPNKICAIIWAVSVMEDERHHTQELIRKASGNCSIMGIRASLTEICEWFGIDKKDLLNMKVAEFVHGTWK
tara:strand:+ start:3661 stop:4545 length:885 start_codon:yes stop_codon:yes gene_type:complete